MLRNGVLKLLGKTLLLLVLVGAIQLGLQGKSSEGLLQKLDALLANRPQAIYLGDSTIGCIHVSDEDRRATTQMLNALLESRQVAGYAHAAHHAEVYELMVERILSSDHPPQVIILPVNLRSFSPVWDGDPAAQTAVIEHQMLLESSRWRRAAEPFFRAFGIAQPPAGDRRGYMNQPVFCGSKQVGRLADFRNGTLDQQLLLNYQYQLKPSHRKVRAFQRMAARAREAGVQLVLYVTPIDLQAASDTVRAPLARQVDHNVEVLREALARQPVLLVDLSRRLDSQHFHYDRHVNEHLKDDGRTFVARKLAEVCRPLLESPRVTRR